MLVFLPSVMMLNTVDPIFVTKNESLLLGRVQSQRITDVEAAGLSK